VRLFAQAEINLLSDMLTRLIKQKLLQTRVLQNGTSMPMQAKTAANVAREVGSDAVAFMVCIQKMALMHLMQHVALCYVFLSPYRCAIEFIVVCDSRSSYGIVGYQQ